MDEIWHRRDVAVARIDRAWYAALVHATILAVLASAIVTTQESWSVSDTVSAIYVALLVVLAIGTAKRNRVAAILLLVLTIWIEGSAWWNSHSLLSLLFLVSFGGCYAFGVRGVLEWHRVERDRPMATAAATVR